VVPLTHRRLAQPIELRMGISNSPEDGDHSQCENECANFEHLVFRCHFWLDVVWLAASSSNPHLLF
jgi:hypothetical protein